jgi:nitrate reductase NapAB chaperone NapD
MNGAYLLINVKSGTEMNVNEELSKISTVLQAKVVTGLHDIICYVEDEDMNTVKETIYAIRKIDGITRTVSCITFGSK